MDFNLKKINKNYYEALDNEAEFLAKNLSNKKNVTPRILEDITRIYNSKKVEYDFKVPKKFEVAYHPPATSDIEFLIARIMYHYSEKNDFGWNILLRRQKERTSPDVRIESAGNTLAIIEIKAKAGWIQPVFSDERFKKRGKRKEDKDQIERIKGTFKKYCDVYKIRQNEIFLLIPTLKEVHRKNSKYLFGHYFDDFQKNSGIPKENLIVLSKNLTLDLDSEENNQYKPTTSFEDFIKKLHKKATNYRIR